MALVVMAIVLITFVLTTNIARQLGIATYFLTTKVRSTFVRTKFFSKAFAQLARIFFLTTFVPAALVLTPLFRFIFKFYVVY